MLPARTASCEAHRTVLALSSCTEPCRGRCQFTTFVTCCTAYQNSWAIVCSEARALILSRPLHGTPRLARLHHLDYLPWYCPSLLSLTGLPPSLRSSVRSTRPRAKIQHVHAVQKWAGGMHMTYLSFAKKIHFTVQSWCWLCWKCLFLQPPERLSCDVDIQRLRVEDKAQIIKMVAVLVIAVMNDSLFLRTFQVTLWGKWSLVVLSWFVMVNIMDP